MDIKGKILVRPRYPNLEKLLPLFIRTRIVDRPVLQKILSNSSWLLAEKIFRLGLGLVVNVIIARHLGPHDFGILNYALSITAVMGSLVYLGLDGIAVRDIVKNPNDTESIMGSVFTLKMIGAIIGYLVIVVFALQNPTSNVESRALLIIGALLLFRPMETINLWFQSKTESKYPAIGRGVVFFGASIGQLTLVLAGVSVLAFATVGLAEYILTALSLTTIYIYKGQTFRAWKIKIDNMLKMLRQSWILILSGFLALIYLKVDQIMLRWMVGVEEVGIYSVAVNFSEVWYFIPTLIAISIFPTLVEMRQNNRVQYYKKLQQGFDVLFAISLCIAVVMTLISTPVISALYGADYERAGGILAIHIWAGLFVFMRALFSKWLIMEDLLLFSLYSHGLGALLNVCLNVILIRSYGGYGAAVATLFSYATASYFMLFLASKTRPIAFLMSKSLLLPLRLVRSGRRVWM